MRTVWGKKAVCATLVAFAALVWMPAAFADSAQYLGEDGQMYTQENAAPVQQGDTIWGTAGGETWYVANGTVTIENRVKVTGDVHLILANSAALTVNGGIEVGEGNSFTVYAQSTEESEMGSLTATARKKGDGAGIGGNNAPLGEDSRYTGAGGTAGSITIHGGKVTATGAEGSAGIGGGTGTVAVYGGTVTATGGTAAESAYYGGAGIGTGGFQESDIIELTVTLAGGQVTATGGAGTVACGAGIGIGGGNYGDVRFTLTISDGVVVATGGAGAEEGGAGTEKGGAGIGTGGESRAGSVNFTATLSGGQVTATGGTGTEAGGAGIGAGGTSTQCDISVAAALSGGQVTAQGGSGTSTGAGVDSSLIISPAAGWNIEAKAGENEAAAKALSGSPFAPGTQTDVTAQVQDKAYFATKAQKLPDKEKPAQNTGGTQKQNPKTGV